MTKREADKKKSLSFLGRFAEESQATPWIEKKPAPPSPPARPAAPLPRAPARPSPRPAAQSPARPKLDPRFEGPKAKQAEEKLLKARRAGEVQRGKTLEWRGMGMNDVPVGIRRTAFDREEPTLHTKIDDVLGKPAEKAGRAKNREKGKRQGGSR